MIFHPFFIKFTDYIMELQVMENFTKADFDVFSEKAAVCL